MTPEEDKPAADLSVLESAGVAFDPTAQHLDLSKEEKRRTTALMLAMNAYKDLIIRDAGMLNAVADLARRNEGPKISSATIDGIVDAAIRFDAFIAGAPAPPAEEATSPSSSPSDP